MLDGDTIIITMLVCLFVPLVLFFPVAAVRRPAPADLNRMFARFFGLGMFMLVLPLALLMLNDGQRAGAGIMLAVGVAFGLLAAVLLPLQMNFLDIWRRYAPERSGPPWLWRLAGIGFAIFLVWRLFNAYGLL